MGGGKEERREKVGSGLQNNYPLSVASSQDDGLAESFVSFGDSYQNVIDRHAIPPRQKITIPCFPWARMRILVAINDAKNGWLEHAKSGTAMNPAEKRSILGYQSRI